MAKSANEWFDEFCNKTLPEMAKNIDGIVEKASDTDPQILSDIHFEAHLRGHCDCDELSALDEIDYDK